MADAGRLRQAVITSPVLSPVTLVRIVVIAAILLGWEALAQSGLLYRDVVPSLLAISKAIFALLSDPQYYWNLGVTAARSRWRAGHRRHQCGRRRPCARRQQVPEPRL